MTPVTLNYMISHAYRVGACTVREAFLESGVTGVTGVTVSFGISSTVAYTSRQFFLWSLFSMPQRYNKKAAFTPYAPPTCRWCAGGTVLYNILIIRRVFS